MEADRPRFEPVTFWIASERFATQDVSNKAFKLQVTCYGCTMFGGIKILFTTFQFASNDSL